MLKFDFCKLLKTPRYTSPNIIVFRNGKFYSLVRDKFLSTRRSKGKGYLTIYVKNDKGKTTTMIVPYIICYLFRNDYLKHGKYEQNYFEYVDGDLNNCDADNIRANYYYYKILQHVSEDVVSVEMCGYEVLVNLDFYKNELHKYRFRKICNGNCVYFLSENSGKNIRLHQVVMNYYNPNMTITGAIDHINHNTLDNTIDNLRHINHIINSMNNMKITPMWNENNHSWNIRYKIDGVGYSKRFSVYKYKTKQLAYDEAINYIESIVLPQKREYLRSKDLQLKRTELNNLIKYFMESGMSKEVYNILANNNILVSEPINSGATIVDVGKLTSEER